MRGSSQSSTDQRARNDMKYFTIDELVKSATAKRLGIMNVPSIEHCANLKGLVENILDPLREKWGAPIIVTSGYRCEKLNKAIGGASKSQHVLGQAADIRTVSDRPEENYKLLHLLIDLKLPFDQLVSEYVDGNGCPDWIHVSYGPRNRRQELTCKNGKYYNGIQ